MTMRGLLAKHGHIETPFDAPKSLLERITYPSLRVAWLDGYSAGASDQQTGSNDRVTR